MLKYFASLIERLNDPAEIDSTEFDLLQHPSLKRMNERELADLPLVPTGKRNAGQNTCPA